MRIQNDTTTVKKKTTKIACVLRLHASRFDAQTQTDRKSSENGNKNVQLSRNRM